MSPSIKSAPDRFVVPEPVRLVADAAKSAGGRAWLVGGSVRDHMLGLPVKDYDIEVHGVPADALQAVLSTLGPVNAVGKSFGVLKVTLGGEELDVSIPRRDSNTGPGHKGISIVGDPHMGFTEAARRRDLTINAIGLDPLTHEVADPWGGLEDIEAKQLRAVDPETFVEDPLRALRVVQFAARFEFAVHPDLERLCRQAPLQELPGERIWGEMEKLLRKARMPSIGASLAREWGIWAKVLPAFDAASDTSDDAALDRVPALAAPRDVVVYLGTWCARLGPDALEQTLDALKVHRFGGHPVRDEVLAIAVAWMELASPCSDTQLRTLAETTPLRLACAVAEARGSTDAQTNLERAERLGVADERLPRLLEGRDLFALGVEKGPGMGEWLRRVRRQQLRGTIASRDEALAWVTKVLEAE